MQQAAVGAAPTEPCPPPGSTPPHRRASGGGPSSMSREDAPPALVRIVSAAPRRRRPRSTASNAARQVRVTRSNRPYRDRYFFLYAALNSDHGERLNDMWLSELLKTGGRRGTRSTRPARCGRYRPRGCFRSSFPGLGGRGDEPPAGRDRSGAGPRGAEQSRGCLRALGPVRASAAPHGRLGRAHRRRAHADRPASQLTRTQRLRTSFRVRRKPQETPHSLGTRRALWVRAGQKTARSTRNSWQWTANPKIRKPGVSSPQVYDARRRRLATATWWCSTRSGGPVGGERGPRWPRVIGVGRSSYNSAPLGVTCSPEASGVTGPADAAAVFNAMGSAVACCCGGHSRDAHGSERGFGDNPCHRDRPRRSEFGADHVHVGVGRGAGTGGRVSDRTARRGRRGRRCGTSGWPS